MSVQNESKEFVYDGHKKEQGNPYLKQSREQEGRKYVQMENQRQNVENKNHP